MRGPKPPHYLVMLSVLTVYRSGGEFTPEYVTRLRDGVAEHLRIPHKFVCMTDDPVDGVDCIPLEHNYPSRYAKAEIFRPDLPFDRVFYIDLSTVVKGSLDEMASQSGICITADFYHGGPSQSVLLYDVGDFTDTWETWLGNPEYYMEIGDKAVPPDFYDQVLLTRIPHPSLRYWQDILPGQLCSFKVDGVPKWARLIKFHGQPRPHDVNWLEKVEYESTLNTPPSKMLENARHNWARGLPRFKETSAHGREMILVAGGPSLEDTLLNLRFESGDVYALNGAHDYLIERKLTPDYMVLLDARLANVDFVKTPDRDVNYLISAVCDPSIFDALEGFNVTIWANEMSGMSHTLPDAKVLVGGGATVGMKTMYLGYLAGYRSFKFFGFDSCYKDGENHAWRQPLNDGEEIVGVWTNGKKYDCAPWMAKQADEFLQQTRNLIGLGCHIEVFGDGLIPAIAKQLQEPVNA